MEKIMKYIFENMIQALLFCMDLMQTKQIILIAILTY